MAGERYDEKLEPLEDPHDPWEPDPGSAASDRYVA